jgi:lysophospholipase L1-like esterase
MASLKNLFGGGGSGVSNPAVNAAKTVVSGTGVKPGSTVTVYKNGTSAGTATASGAGAWSYTFGAALAAGDVVTYDAILTSPAYTVPTVVTLAALSLSPATATVGTAYSGTVTGKTSTSTLALTGAGAAGLNVSGSTVSGTPTTAGPVGIVETLAGATGSPRTSSNLLTVSAVAAVPAAKGLVAIGDSNTAGLGATGYPAIWANLTGLPATNLGVSGRTLATMDANFVSENVAATYNAASTNTAIITGGTNDIRGGASDTSLRSILTSLVAKCKAAGFVTYVGVLLPEQESGVTSQQLTYIANWQAWQRANWASLGADGLVDFGGLPQADPTNRIYFQADQLHATTKLQYLMADRARSSLGVTLVSDTTPDAFAFTATNSATASTAYTSNAVTLTGFTSSVPFTVTGGTLVVNGTDAGASGTVAPYDIVSAKGTASATASAAVNVAVTIGGVSSTYTITTAAAGSTTSTTKLFGTAMGGEGTFSADLLTFTTGNAGSSTARTDTAITGKKVFAAQAVSRNGVFLDIGIVTASGNTDSLGFGAAANGIGYYDNNSVFSAGSNIASGSASYTVGALVGVVVDQTGNKLWFTQDGTNYYGTTGPLTAAQVAAGTSGINISTVTALGTIYGAVGGRSASGNGWTLQTSFPWTIPSGFTLL